MDEVADYLGVSKSRVYKMTSAHVIDYYKPSGKTIYISRSDLNDWICGTRIAFDEEIRTEAWRKQCDITSTICAYSTSLNAERRADSDRTLTSKFLAMYYDEESSEIIGCFYTLLITYKGHTEGMVVGDFGETLIVRLNNGSEIEEYRDEALIYD